MKISQKARAATIGVIATILLAGCAAGPSSTPDSSENAPTEAPVSQTKPEPRNVRAVEVIDPMTVVVTPLDESDELFGTEFSVHVQDFVAPSEGDCGYEEALAVAKDAAVGPIWSLTYPDAVDDNVWIASDGDHFGWLNSNGNTYGQELVVAGMAFEPAGADPSYLANPQREAQNAGTGLWTSCPDFGA